MPFQSKRGDGGAIPVAPADCVLSDSETVISGVDSASTGGGVREGPLREIGDGARVNAGLPIGMLLAGFTPPQINDANDTLCRLIDDAIAAAKSGADGAVTLRFVAGRDGSRRVRIGVTVGGRPVAEPAVFEAAKAEG